MSARVVARILAVGWLTLVWCAVMESAALGTVVAGAAVGAALVVLFPVAGSPLAGTRLRPVAFVALNVVLFGELVRANLLVAWAVISPRRAGLRRGIVAVPLVPSSELIVHLILNAVSLTPGTLILEVRRDPVVLFVHVLQLRSEADVHLGVLRIQRRLVAALGPRSTLPAIDGRLAVLEHAARTGAPVPGPDPDPDLVEDAP